MCEHSSFELVQIAAHVGVEVESVQSCSVVGSECEVVDYGLVGDTLPAVLDPTQCTLQTLVRCIDTSCTLSIALGTATQQQE